MTWPSLSDEAAHDRVGLADTAWLLVGELMTGVLGIELATTPLASKATSNQKSMLLSLMSSCQAFWDKSPSLTSSGAMETESTASGVPARICTVASPSFAHVSLLTKLATVKRAVTGLPTSRSERAIQNSIALYVALAAAADPAGGSYHVPPSSAYTSTSMAPPARCTVMLRCA